MAIGRTPAPGEPSALTVRISARTRKVLDDIRRQYRLENDADAIRVALEIAARIGESVVRNERIITADPAGRPLAELTFSDLAG